MPEVSFKESLRNDNVIEDAKKIVPRLAANRQRLEVSKIEKIIAKETDETFDKMTTDKDVYEVLKSLDPNDLRRIFKACVESLGFECDLEALYKKNKNRVLALFFYVLAVYPEAFTNVEDSDGDADTSDGEINLELFAEVFPNFSKAADVDFSKVANYLPAQFQNVASTDELKEALSAEKIPVGKIVRDFVEAVLKISGLESDLKKLTALRREDYLPLFFHAVNFNFPKKTAAPPPPPPPVQKEKAELPKLTFGHMQALYNAAQKISVESEFDIADPLRIFENNPITIKDEFYLDIPDGYEIYRGLAAIATSDDEIAAIGHVEDGKIDGNLLPHLVFDWKMIDKEKFINKKTFKAVLLPAAAENFFAQTMSKSLAESYSGEVWIKEFSVKYRELNITDKPLCIDFGTSNTTAGTYDDDGEPEQVTFRDVTSDEIKFAEILPTVVYVESCNDGIINFKHGYEARREIIAANYNSKATTFYEIKRWINSLDVEEEVVGSDGKETARVTRREILRDYLLYGATCSVMKSYCVA